MTPGFIPPILEFDPSELAIINPVLPFQIDPSITGCVLCFFQDVLQERSRKGDLNVIGHLESELGDNPLFVYETDGTKLAVLHPGLGAPLAAGYLDELISLGLKSFMVCGGCGVLDPTLEVGFPIVITSAVRDEGTSYHYLPPAREVIARKLPVEALEETLQGMQYPYTLAKTWTTDAFYRETANRRDRRLSEGCRVVEMEAAAFFAAAEFRGVDLGQVVYAGDLVIPDGWDNRDWNSRTEIRTLLFEVAARACIALVHKSASIMKGNIE